MAELMEYTTHPTLSQPALVVALEGWVDAGMAAGGAIGTILAEHDHELVARFDTDALLDHRARRPLLSIRDGVSERLVWPAIELRAVVDRSGHHTLFLIGAEPDHLWSAFTEEVIRAALDLDVRTIVGLGAYPAAVPHTRDVKLSLTSPSRDVLEAHPGYIPGTVEVPAGIQAVIEVAGGAAGLPSMGLWAQVPHYIGGISYPAAAAALVQHLNIVADLDFGTGSLVDDAAASRAQLDGLVGENEQYRSMLGQLEELFDETEATSLGPLPTGDELAAEFQAFLREQGGD